jgi:hypothetical protein
MENNIDTLNIIEAMDLFFFRGFKDILLQQRQFWWLTIISSPYKLKLLCILHLDNFSLVI